MIPGVARMGTTQHPRQWKNSDDNIFQFNFVFFAFPKTQINTTGVFENCFGWLACL